MIIYEFSSVQLLSCVWLLGTTWTAASLDSLSITNSQSLLKLMSLSQWCHSTISSSVISFSHLQYFPASGSFQMSQFLTWDGQSIGVLALASVLPMNFPGGSDGKASVYNAGDLGSIPGSGRSPREGNGNLLQYSCLENSLDGGTW